MASASAVECTATVGMPSSLQARSTRSAISPRLAIRIFSNMTIGRMLLPCRSSCPALLPGIHAFAASPSRKTWMAGASPAMTEEYSFDDHQRFAELDGLPVLEQDLGDGAGARRRIRVRGLIRLVVQNLAAGLTLPPMATDRL